MSGAWYLFWAVMVMSAVTILLRAVPFILFGGRKRLCFILVVSSRPGRLRCWWFIASNR